MEQVIIIFCIKWREQRFNLVSLWVWTRDTSWLKLKSTQIPSRRTSHCARVASIHVYRLFVISLLQSPDSHHSREKCWNWLELARLRPKRKPSSSLARELDLRNALLSSERRCSRLLLPAERSEHITSSYDSYMEFCGGSHCSNLLAYATLQSAIA